MSKTPPPLDSKGKLIWSGRPSIGSYVAIYGAVSLIVAAILITAEFLIGASTSIGSDLLPASLNLGGLVIPFPVELFTAVVISLVFIWKALSLALLRARSKYELYDDGLYLSLGIVNLESTFLAPIAFSDARLIRTWTMRIARRGQIIVDANDGRHFHLEMIENPMEVQSLIRATLSRPRVRM